MLRQVIAVAVLCLSVAISCGDDQQYGKAVVGGRVSPDGKEIQVDLPNKYHLHNKGGSDGAGLCVFTSISHSARWQGVKVLENFRDWMTKYPGGGWPEKVTKMITAICKEKGVKEPNYLQVEGTDLDIVKLALKTGRLPATTYCWSPTGRYGGGKISHMVNTPHMDEQWAAVLDNNHPGDGEYEWMTLDDYRKTYIGGRTGWTVILLDPGPPPPPKN